MTDVVDLAQALLRVPSVTPARGTVFDVLANALERSGFEVARTLDGPHDGDAADGPVENLLAHRGDAARGHLLFAGHLDVVPAGEGWRVDPFGGAIADGLLVGRGAVDMKGAVAAFVAAAGAAVPGRLTLAITGDEEGPGLHGTLALLPRLRAGSAPDLVLVGEPTSVARVGDTVKIGRRGSVNLTVRVEGTEGHVAYPQLADNPIPPLVAILAELDAWRLDAGTEWFEPSNLEVTGIDVGNRADNVIPRAAAARVNIRFNDRQGGEALLARVRAVAARHSRHATVTGRVSGEAFVSTPGPALAQVEAAVTAETGSAPVRSTGGGTSDARFLHVLGPVAEVGLVGRTMHKHDEAVPVADLHTLTAIYARIIRSVCGGV